MKNDAKIEEELSVQNWQEFDECLSEHSKISKMWTLPGCLWPKYIMFELKKYWGVKFDGTDSWYKIWRKTDLCFQKWHEEFGKFSPEHLKVSKWGLWWDSFIQSWKMYELNIYRGVICYGNEKRCKIWRGTHLSFQNWHEDFVEFWPEHSEISKMCTLMRCLWPKYIMFELNKYSGVKFGGTEDWYKIWRKTDLCFQKWHEEFGKLSSEHLKVSKWRLWWDSFIES